jgi:hypothetical protein
MNWPRMGSRTLLQSHVVTYEGTSEPPFLRLETGLVFVAV